MYKKIIFTILLLFTLVSYMVLRKGILYWVWYDKTIHPVKEIQIIKEPIIKEIK